MGDYEEIFYTGRMEYFYKLSLNNVARSWEDELTMHLFDMGAMGVSEDLSFRQDNEKYIPETLETEVFDLVAYFENPPSSEETQQLEEKYKGLQWGILREPNKDWLEEWKKGYKATELSAGVWVVPSWLKAPENTKVNIFVDPGMAFGTGTHATTQIASRFVCDLFSQFEIKSVLDVGAGTGILAILANKLGANRVYCTEIDKDAREVAKQNIHLNQCEGVIVFEEQVDALVDRTQLVIANIIDGVLVQIKNDLKRLCLPGGYMLLTGILEEREKGFIQRFEIDPDEFEIIERQKEDEWVGLLLRRKA